MFFSLNWQWCGLWPWLEFCRCGPQLAHRVEHRWIFLNRNDPPNSYKRSEHILATKSQNSVNVDIDHFLPSRHFSTCDINCLTLHQLPCHCHVSFDVGQRLGMVEPSRNRSLALGGFNWSTGNGANGGDVFPEGHIFTSWNKRTKRLKHNVPMANMTKSYASVKFQSSFLLSIGFICFGTAAGKTGL